MIMSMVRPRAIAGLLIPGFRVPVPTAPLVLPVAHELGKELGDDFAGADRAGIIDDTNAGAPTNQLAHVVRGKPARYPPN